MGLGIYLIIISAFTRLDCDKRSNKVVGMSFEPHLMLLRGEASSLEIDSAARYKLGLPEEYRDFYEPGPLLIEMVREGHLGKKTGKGFYQY